MRGVRNVEPRRQQKSQEATMMEEGQSQNNLRQDELLRRNADDATATRLTDLAITQKAEIYQGSSPHCKKAATGNEVLLPPSLSLTNYLAVR